MSNLHSWARRSALIFSIVVSVACTRTVTVKQPPERVEIRVPVPVQIRSLCPLLLPSLPRAPTRTAGKTCENVFGRGAVCYDPGNAIRMASLIGTLTEMYMARSACEAAEDPQ